MDDVKAAPTVGIVGCLLVLLVLTIPYLLVAESSAVGAYYGAGAITPLAGGLFALVGVIVFAAGREERSDPSLVAGAGLVFGLFIFLISALWAVTVPASVPLQLGSLDGLAATLMELHRWLLAVVALLVPVSAAWYARTLRLI
ncbi:DUF7548 family protein [Halorarius litoreus]|uniref:DUF7548 family protein n=1 Tax=Halorarius litoreus TaxID=2962676 RepID=UPI0020CD81BC|nr:hypothetical protein [Halorarius litoreus]